MNSLKTLQFENLGPIATITLNRPEVHNAFNALMIDELTKILSAIEGNSQFRTVLISANGKNFCAGADLEWMQQMASTHFEQNKNDALALSCLLQRLAHFPLPTIALAHGRVMGGGCGIAACCDFVIASQDSCFCFSEVKLGLIPATIAPYIIRRIGYQAARRYFMSAEMIDSDTASQIQLIDYMVSQDILLSSGHDLAQKINKNGPNAMNEIKKLLNQLVPIDKSLIESTAEQLATIRCSNEAQEGIQAFLQRRPAKWSI